jgi:hypothetical protein
MELVAEEIPDHADKYYRQTNEDDDFAGLLVHVYLEAIDLKKNFEIIDSRLKNTYD